MLSTQSPPTFLRRYTDLPALLHILTSHQVTLLDPKTWDDKNDSYFMSVYKEKKKFRSVLALCFSQASETYHHWRVFSNGPAGVCIVFDRVELIEDFQKSAQVKFGPVNYLTLTEAKKRRPDVEELPFVKRYGFKPESEFRVLYTSTVEELSALNVPVRLSSIRSISLSPWMHSSLSKSTASAIRAIRDCEKLKVSRSTLISNEQWKTYAHSAT
jgi:hypothetical protein